MRAISFLRHKIVVVIIQYFMIEINDSAGRLIVVLPMRLRHAGRFVCVFVDGRMVAEFRSVGEAAKYAKELARERCPGPREASITPAEGSGPGEALHFRAESEILARPR
jgi:hypothetical protein